MSREIKFRAWNKHENKWHERVLVGCNSDGNDYVCNLVWEDEQQDWVHFDEFCGDVVQYTGLKDKNGVEIYEGDVVQYPAVIQSCEPETATVSFKNGCFYGGYVLKKISRMSEVIGNIYENPELLGGDEA